MEESKLLEIIIQYYKAIGISEPTNDDKFFVNNIELKLAEALIKDFGNITAKKVAAIISAMTNIYQ